MLTLLLRLDGHIRRTSRASARQSIGRFILLSFGNRGMQGQQSSGVSSNRIHHVTDRPCSRGLGWQIQLRQIGVHLLDQVLRQARIARLQSTALQTGSTGGGRVVNHDMGRSHYNGGQGSCSGAAATAGGLAEGLAVCRNFGLGLDRHSRSWLNLGYNKLHTSE